MTTTLFTNLRNLLTGLLLTGCLSGNGQIVYSNVAAGKTVSSSSSDNAAHDAAFAVDENLGTRFASGNSDNEWISIDLGRTFLLDKVKLTWASSYGKDFDILFSNTGTFTDMYEDSIQVRNHVLSENKIAGIDSFALRSNTIARYVLIRGIHSVNGHGYSLWEISVMGSVSLSGMLPVSVTALEASVQANVNTLSWSTVTENSNAGFAVERSYDAVNFTAIGWVTSVNAGTNVSHYSYADRNANSGRTYYRIKQVWSNGQIAYSTVIAVNTIASYTVNIYPVPATDHITVDYRGTAAEEITVTLLNMSGQPVYMERQNLKGLSQTITINRTARMLSGQYFLNIRGTSGKVYTESVILR